MEYFTTYDEKGINECNTVTIHNLGYHSKYDLIATYKLLKIPTIIDGIDLHNVQMFKTVIIDSINGICICMFGGMDLTDEYLVFCKHIDKLLNLPFKYKSTDGFCVPFGSSILEVALNEVIKRQCLHF